MIKQLCIWMVLLATVSCGNDFEKIKIMSEPNSLPVEKGKNIDITYTDMGQLTARITAPEILRFSNEIKNYTEMPAGIKVVFYNAQQQPESSLRAGYAIRYDREKRMLARDNVVLVNQKGDTLRTEELNWDEASQKIHSDKFIRITTQDEIIMGTGFESNPEFTQYRINQISGTISLKE
jgi:LPS export ABC transporter protein LptC